MANEKDETLNEMMNALQSSVSVFVQMTHTGAKINKECLGLAIKSHGPTIQQECYMLDNEICEHLNSYMQLTFIANKEICSEIHDRIKKLVDDYMNEVIYVETEKDKTIH